MSFDIKKIAHLARIAVSEQEGQAMAPKLENLMQMIDDLQKVDTNGIKPMANPLEHYQRLREDTVTETDQHTLYQTLAPQVAADLYLVPQVIEGGE